MTGPGSADTVVRVVTQLQIQFTECLHQKLTGPVEEAVQAAGPAAQPTGAAAEPAPAIDLGATVLPVLLKTYGRQIAAAVVVLLLLGWLWRRRR
jgi:hypothetical protein